MNGIARRGSLALLVLAFGCKDEVVVVVPVATVEVQGPGILVAGETAQFTAVPRDDQGNRLTGRSISWSTSSGSLASVSSSGLVTGMVGGVVSITANCEGKGGSAELQVHNPMPVVTSTDPASLSAGSGAVQLRVLGSGFVSASVVRWNGSDRVTTFVSGSELRAAILEGDLASPGTAQLTVANPSPGGGSSGDRPLAVSNPVPVVSSLSPDNMPMGYLAPVLLTVTGTGFHAGSVVRWEGNDLPTTYVSGTKLEATIPAGEVERPGRRTVTVRNPPPGGGESAAAAFPVRIDAWRGPFVDGGGFHTCALTTEGRAYCWGMNNGALGDGGTENADQPVEVAGGLRFVAITTGASHTCALDEVGQAHCWGNGSSGALGDGTSTDRHLPVPVSGGWNFLRLDAGEDHTCGVTYEGQAYCWGWNAEGQLGDGTTTNRSMPVAVEQGAVQYQSVVAGWEHTCAVARWTGAVYCWGRNDAGQLGDNSVARRTTPVPVVGLSNIAFLALGGLHTCASTQEGAGYCWGLGMMGQLGDGNSTISTTPVPLFGAPHISLLTAGLLHTCGVVLGEGAHCWGSGDYGQLGIGSWSGQNRPTKVPGLDYVNEMAAGAFHTCVRDGQGDLLCWGDYRHGQVGNGKTGTRLDPVPVQGGPAGWAHVSSGDEFTCALSSTGAPYCWGKNSVGQLGNGTLPPSASPVPASTAQAFVALGSGGQHVCGLTSGGEALCWGYGGGGAVGNGSWGDASIPTPVAGGRTYSSLSVGGEHSCALAGASIYCWGSNVYGQLGDGTITDRNVPTPVAVGGIGLIFGGVVAGGGHSCAILAPFGGVACWGYNAFGQLGDGTTTNRLSPVSVTGLSGIVALSLGQDHTCALDGSGKAWCWGSNEDGALGDGGQIGSTVPVAVTGGRLFRSIHANRHHTCAVTLDNRGYCWGRNWDGQLGIGSQENTAAPTEIAGGRSWAELGSGSSLWHTCGVTIGGAAYCWGRPRQGELGNGGWGVELEPSPVLGGREWGPPRPPLGIGGVAGAGWTPGPPLPRR